MRTQQIHKEISDSVLRLSWDNKNMQKDKSTFIFLVLFWIVWAPVTLFMTLLLFYGGPVVFLSIWLLFGWLGTVLIPYSLLARSWQEWLSLTPETLSFGYTGFWALKPRILSVKNIREIAIGYCNDGADGESIVTLNVYDNTRMWNGGRYMLAYWLSPDLKEEIFNAIQEFSTNAKIQLSFRRFG